MKKIQSLIILLILFNHLTAQVFVRQAGENEEIFVKRIYNITEFAHPIIVTKELDSTKQVIICFVKFSKENTNGGFIGFILTPSLNNFYRQTIIDTFWQGGGIRAKEITTIFFANCDNEMKREIIVMSSAISKSPRFAPNDVVGNFYESFVYDNFDLNNPPNKLIELKNISEFFQEFDGKIYSPKTGKLLNVKKAKYKSEISIRQKLKELGF
jgi:hypothetical protein